MFFNGSDAFFFIGKLFGDIKIWIVIGFEVLNIWVFVILLNNYFLNLLMLRFLWSILFITCIKIWTWLHTNIHCLPLLFLLLLWLKDWIEDVLFCATGHIVYFFDFVKSWLENALITSGTNSRSSIIIVHNGFWCIRVHYSLLFHFHFGASV